MRALIIPNINNGASVLDVVLRKLRCLHGFRSSRRGDELVFHGAAVRFLSTPIRGPEAARTTKSCGMGADRPGMRDPYREVLYSRYCTVREYRTGRPLSQSNESGETGRQEGVTMTTCRIEFIAFLFNLRTTFYTVSQGERGRH
jgi:hypothetical protein